jgi:O-antigen ligase
MARLLIMPMLTVLAYVVFASPEIEAINFGGESTSSTTAGYGTNQVSTILGVGFFIPMIFYLMKRRLFPHNILNIAITLLFLFRSMLSFSRGGVYVPTFAIVVPFLILKKDISPRQYLKHTIIGLFIIVGVFIYTNQITHDALSERYLIQKEEETGEGENKLLNEYTTGRWEIFLIDLKIWQAHPVFGQGVGISKFQHPNQAAAHIEFSRLLAEHGFLGLVLAVGLFIWLPLKEIKKRTTNQERIWTLALFLLSILSTFHAATRTLVPVILYGAAYLNINAIQHTEDT